MAEIVDIGEYRKRRDAKRREAIVEADMTIDFDVLAIDIQDALKTLRSAGIVVEMVKDPIVGEMLRDMREQGLMTEIPAIVAAGDQI